VSEDGFFKSTVTGPFLIDTVHVPLTWQLVKALDGTLLHLDVNCADSNMPDDQWKTAAYELVTSVLTAALSERRQQFFRRNLFFYIGGQLDGEYWLPGFRLAPAYPGDPEPYLINAERVLAFDMIVNAIDDQNAHVLASEAAHRHAARVSLLLNVGLYSQAHEVIWVLPVIDDKRAPVSLRCQRFFNHPSIMVTNMPSKGELCPLGQYRGSLAERYRVAGKLLSLPPQSRKILRGIDLADPVVADAFDRGARLYQVASVVGHQFPSVGLAYRIAAVEAIAQADASAASFDEFMHKYIASTAGFDNLLDYMYGSVRSAHFHAGEFPLGEYARTHLFDPLMDSESVQLSNIHRVCYELTREAIVNWMESIVPEVGTPDTEDVQSNEI
jgi:hypothetical protein